jgi:Tetratricopeptide repeat
VRISSRLTAVALIVAAPALGGPQTDGGPEVIQAEAGHAVRIPSAALLVSGMSGGDLAVDRLVLTLPSAGDASRVLVLLEVDLTTLPREVGADLEAAAYALSEGDRVVATAAMALRLQPETAPRGLQLAMTLALPPGDYTLRTLVRERGSGALGLGGGPLEVPAPSPAAQAAWWLRPGAGWILGVDDPATRETLRAGSQRAARLPALRPGESAALRLLGPAGGSEVLRLNARILTGDGETIAIAPLSVDAFGPDGSDAAVLDARLVLPTLAPGSYRLRVAGAEVAGASEAFAELEFFVPSTPGAGALEETAQEAPADEETAQSVRDAAEEYRELLRVLAAGDVATARDRLRALEIGLQQGAGNRTLLRFSRAEQEVMSRLARQAPAALPALVLLHAPLLEDYSVRGGAVLQAYTATTLELLARLLVRRAETPAGRTAAARALSTAGSILQRTGWHEASARVLDAAIALDGSLDDALLGAAAGREKAGDYAAAVPWLEALVAAQPHAEEARLRLALNLIRTGEADRGAEILDALARGAENEWISILAFQELARREADEARAEALLRQGLERWPGERGLLLLLAQRLDGRQSAAATVELLQPLLDDPGEAPSPRIRYNRWPRPREVEPSDLEALARWLDESVEAAR